MADARKELTPEMLEIISGGTDPWLDEFFQEMYVKYGKDPSTFREDQLISI
ncbi:MAG: hypothetical protein ILA15_11505 [Clostridiales bacterium]|nr:hypothetical protein [Clostridiales bacterium]